MATGQVFDGDSEVIGYYQISPTKGGRTDLRIAALRCRRPTVSHHTKILAEVGLITGDKRGRWTYWPVSPTRTRFVTELLGSAVAAV